MKEVGAQMPSLDMFSCSVQEVHRFYILDPSERGKERGKEKEREKEKEKEKEKIGIII